MASPSKTMPPLMWVNGDGKNNVIVLTGDSVYLATIKRIDLHAIDLKLEDGEFSEELLPASATKVCLKEIQRIQFKHTRVKPHEMVNKEVWVDHQRGRLILPLVSEAVRDELVQNLNERVGPWPANEAEESPWRILGRYIYFVAVLCFVTAFFAWIYLSGIWSGRGNVLDSYFETLGVWGVVGPGVVACVCVIIVGVQQLKSPPIIVTYQPTSEPEA